MNMLRIAIAITGLLILAPVLAYSGSLDAPGAPGSSTSAMFTITDIYNRLDTGTGTARRTGAFTEPVVGPGTGTGHTLDEVMAKAPVMDDVNGAVASDVLQGKTYWGVTVVGWGTGTGSLSTQTLSSGTTTVKAGNYTATTLTTVDGDLASGNIRQNTTIFGVQGSTNVVDTTTGDAVAGDMLLNKKAWVDGTEVTGSIATQTLSPGTTTVIAGFYNATTLTTVDGGLASGNIRSGQSIFGVSGSTNVVDTTTGDAVAGDMLLNKKAWVDGTEVTGSIATQTLSPGTTTISAGFYEAADLAAIDTDLTAANIGTGTTIFGVTGSLVSSGGCSGTLNGTRWCDNGDGTVTDLTTGLVWLQAADWGGTVAFWQNASGTQNAHDKAASLTAAGNGALSDSSVEGDWRLPTKTELVQLTTGSENVLSGSMRAFTGVQSSHYWSSTTFSSPAFASFVNLVGGNVGADNKTSAHFVWPVRGGQ